MYSIGYLSAITDLSGYQIDWVATIKLSCVIAVGIFAVGAIFRAFLGRGSSLTRSVSAVLNILLIYVSAVMLYRYFPALHQLFNSLPFTTMTADHAVLWDVSHLPDLILYPAVLQMSILALLVNTLETFLPRGRSIITWYLYRTVTAMSALILYFGLYSAVNHFAPKIFDAWAETILIAFWGIILLIGLLKLIFSVLLSIFNPIIGACYAFFFSNLFGKQFTKAILTTIFMVLIIFYLNQFGLTQIIYSEVTLASYGPMSLILLIALYLFGKIL